MQLFLYFQLLLTFCGVKHICGEIIPYFDHNIMPLHPEYLTIPKFSSRDAPHWSPGKGQSYIDLSRIQISLDCSLPPPPPPSPGVLPPPRDVCHNATFQILMFEEPKEMPWMNYWTDKQFCCTAKMITDGE